MLNIALKCELITAEARLELVIAVVKTSNTAVKYVFGATKCPVCALIGIDSNLGVFSTQEQIRYCNCDTCGCTIKAVGETREQREAGADYGKITKPVAQQQSMVNNKDVRKTAKGKTR